MEVTDLARCPGVRACSCTPNWDFVHEFEYYPVSHLMLPLFLILYLGNRITHVLICAFVVMFWEVIERFMLLVTHSFVIFPNNEESDPDEALSDVFMGFFGILLGVYIRIALRMPLYVVFVPGRWEVAYACKYLFQFLAIAAPSVLVEVTGHHRLRLGHHSLPVGYMIFFGVAMLEFLLFAVWNRNDPRWMQRTEPAVSLPGLASAPAGSSYVTTYVRVKQTRTRYIKEQMVLFITLLLMFVSWIYRYMSVFSMVAVHTTVVFFFYSTVMLNLSNVMFPRYPEVDPDRLRDRR